MKSFERCQENEAIVRKTKSMSGMMKGRRDLVVGYVLYIHEAGQKNARSQRGATVDGKHVLVQLVGFVLAAMWIEGLDTFSGMS